MAILLFVVMVRSFNIWTSNLRLFVCVVSNALRLRQSIEDIVVRVSMGLLLATRRLLGWNMSMFDVLSSAGLRVGSLFRVAPVWYVLALRVGISIALLMN